MAISRDTGALTDCVSGTSSTLSSPLSPAIAPSLKGMDCPKSKLILEMPAKRESSSASPTSSDLIFGFNSSYWLVLKLWYAESSIRVATQPTFRKSFLSPISRSVTMAIQKEPCSGLCIQYVSFWMLNLILKILPGLLSEITRPFCAGLPNVIHQKQQPCSFP